MSASRGLSFSVDLSDGLTRPARSMAKATEAFAQQLERMESVSAGFEKLASSFRMVGRSAKNLDKATAALERFRVAATGMPEVKVPKIPAPAVPRAPRPPPFKAPVTAKPPGARGGLPGIGGLAGEGVAGAAGISGLVSALGPMVAAVLSVRTAWHVAGAAAHVALEGMRYGIEAVSKREDNLLTFKTLLGGDAGKADALNSFVEKFAAVSPFSTEESLGWSKQLLAGGFKDLSSDLGPLLAAAGEFQALQPEQGAERFIRAISQIKGKGKLMGGELLQLSEAGLGQEQVFEAIAKKMKVTPAAARHLQEQGKVSANIAIEAIVSSVAGMTGKVGNLMDARSKTVGGLLSTVQSRPFELFSRAGMGEGAAGFDLLKTKLSEVAALLDATTGKVGVRLVGTLQRTFGQVLGMLGGLDVEGLLTRMATGFDWVASSIAPLVSAALSVGQVFMTSVSPALAMLSWSLGGSTNWLGGLTFAFQVLAAVVGSTLAVAGEALAIVLAPIRMATEAIGWLIDSGFRLASAFSDIGYNTSSGFAKGISKGMPQVIEESNRMAQTPGAITTAQNKIHSPSRLFMELGAFTAEGFAMGVQQGTPGVAGAVGNLVAPPQLGGGAPGRGAIHVELHFAGGPGGSVDSQSVQLIRDAVEQSLARVLRQAAPAF